MAWYGMRHGMVWYSMTCYGTAWYGMVWYGMAWYGMVWHGMVWYGMARHGMEEAWGGMERKGGGIPPLLDCGGNHHPLPTHAAEWAARPLSLPLLLFVRALPLVLLLSSFLELLLRAVARES